MYRQRKKYVKFFMKKVKKKYKKICKNRANAVIATVCGKKENC